MPPRRGWWKAAAARNGGGRRCPTDRRCATGAGFVVLESAEGGADLLSADELADKLSGCNLRLAVLGTCQGGRRDGSNP